MDSPNTWSVSEVNRAIGRALDQEFAEAFWVVGEIQGYDRDVGKASQRRWGQVYFELIEKEPGADTVKAGIKAILWGEAHRALGSRLRDGGGDLRLQDGLQVKLLCKIDFYWPRANLQVKVLDVDAHFTLGDMERARRALIDALQREDLFDRNRSTVLPRVALRVGLVTSEGSAAYHDFMEELRSSGYAFEVHLADARMQGAETEGDVVRALAALSQNPQVEVIVLVRGGGSRSDLIWFDKEKVARAVTRCPRPVVVGIGHEIDSSVVDLVAHTSRKTPTAVAQFLVERVRAFEVDLAQTSRRLAEAALRQCEGDTRALTEAARVFRETASRTLAVLGEALFGNRELLKASARRHLTVLAERLKAAPARLENGWRRTLQTQAERLESFRRESELKDPRRILARGYCLLYAGGWIAKSVRSVERGVSIEARLRDGVLTAQVLAKRENSDD